MAHRHDVYEYGIYREHEIKYVGKFGAKGEKRAKKKKATPEQVKTKSIQQGKENITEDPMQL